jgi:putative transposase
MAQQVVVNRGISIRLACNAFGVSETCYRYQPILSSENEVIEDWLLKLPKQDSDWGFGLCFDYFRNVACYSWNHKRVYRIYCELSLNLRIKPRRRLKRHTPEPLKEPLRSIRYGL